MSFDCNPQYNPQPSGPSEVRAEGLDLGGLLLPDRNRDLGGEILKRGEAIVLFDELTYRTFEPLRTGSAAAVVVRGYLPTDVALQYAQKILTVGRSEIGPYANLSDDLRKIGRTLFESTAGGGDIVADGIKGYLDAAEGYRRKLAALTSEIGAWPMERIRHDLHDALGAEPLRLMDREAFAGLVRVVANGGQIKPHQDDLAREFPDLPFAASLSVPGSVQVAGNLYLQLPDEGGALRLWNRRLSRAELKSMRCPSSDYGVDEKLVGAPIVEYVPKPGDLMFFDSTKLHAVSPSQGKERVSISFFMGMSPVETRFWS